MLSRLRHVEAAHPNHIWGIDLTYIRLHAGWMYLVAVLDWFSRYVVSWELDQTLEIEFVLRAVERALELGVEIINDPSGLTFEPQLARVVSNHDAGLILNHMRGRPEMWAKLAPIPDPMATIARELEAAVSRARSFAQRTGS